MKKYFKLLLLPFIVSVCLLFTSFFSKAYADQTVELYLDPPTLSIGSTIQTKIMLSVTNDYNIGGFDIQLKVSDPQVFVIQPPIDENTSQFNEGLLSETDSNAGTISYARINTAQRLSGTILLGTITLKAQKAGSATITFRKKDISDKQKGLLLPTVRDASYTVGGGAAGPTSPSGGDGGASRTPSRGSGSPAPTGTNRGNGTAPSNNNCTDTEMPTELGCIPTDPIGFAAKFYGIGLSLIGGVALLFLIYGGYLIMTSTGNPVQIENGRSYIFYAIMGLLLAIFGYVFIQVVIVDVLHIPGFS